MNNEVTILRLKGSSSIVIYSKSKVLMERVAELTGKHNTQITYSVKGTNWSLLYTSIHGSAKANKLRVAVETVNRFAEAYLQMH